MYGVIYLCTNLTNNKKYVGQTVQTLDKRKKGHYYRAFVEQYKLPLYNAIRRDGWEMFKWEIIDHANSKEELNEKEIFWIQYCNTYRFKKDSWGYNMSLGGAGNSGYKLSEEARLKVSIRRKGNRASDETRLKMSNARKGENGGFFGKHHTEETRMVLRRINTGKSSPMKGKKHSKESIDKITNNSIMANVFVGEKNAKSKLTNEQVIQIKKVLINGDSIESLSKKFEVNINIIRNIKNLKTWMRVGQEYNKMLEDMNVANSLENRNIYIIDLFKKGYTNKQISKMLSVTYKAVAHVVLFYKKSIGEKPTYDRKKERESSEAIIKYYLEGLSNQEIANLLGIAKGTVSRNIIKYKKETNVIIKSNKQIERENLEKQVYDLLYVKNISKLKVQELLNITYSQLRKIIEKFNKQ